MNKYDRVAELLAASHPDMLEFAAVAGGIEFVEEFSLSLVECAVGILTKSLTMKEVKAHSGAAIRFNCFITALRTVGEFAGYNDIKQELEILSSLLNSNSCPLADLTKAVEAVLQYQEKLNTCDDMSEIPALLFHIVDPSSAAVAVFEGAQASLVSRGSEAKGASALHELDFVVARLKSLRMTDWSSTELAAWSEHAAPVIAAIAKAEAMKLSRGTQVAQVELRRDLLSDLDLHVAKLCRQRQAAVLEGILDIYDVELPSSWIGWADSFVKARDQFNWADQLGLGRGPISLSVV